MTPRRIIPLLLAVAAALPAGRPLPARACAGPPPAPPVDHAPAVRAEADWILTTISCDGAISLTPERDVVTPYAGNLAALGLARAFGVTADPRYAAAAWAWLAWVQRHQDPFTGYSTDHVRSGGSWYSTGTVDATDSAAATYLIALAETYRATGDQAHLRVMLPGIRRSLRAIESTTDDDGMTYALPGHEWKYAMDQAEVYAGLLAAAQVAGPAGDPIRGAQAAAAAATLWRAAERLWNEESGVYDWALGRTGARRHTDIGHWYPSATAQPWVIAFGLAPAHRWPALVSAFDATHPDWDAPVAVKTHDLGPPAPIGYWPMIALAYARAGLPQRALRGVQSIKDHASGELRVYPFTPAVAAALILVETEPSVAALRAAARA